MHTIELVSTDGKTIYCGIHHSLNDAIESAIQKNIPLDGIDLSYATLNHINLDGVIFRNASFKGADLTGANMSEAEFLNCNFSSADLTDACLCYSNINHCNFRLCLFKDTDVAMASLTNCEFEGFSAFHLRFHSAHHISNLTYHHFTKPYLFHSAPTIINSGRKIIALLENTMICNDISHTFEYVTLPNSREKELSL